MTSSDIADPSLKTAAEVLQQQLIYNGEVLDTALESLRSYKAGTQSLAYLDSSVYLAYALLRMLEKWGKEKGSETYVRQKIAKKKRKNKGGYIVPLFLALSCHNLNREPRRYYRRGRNPRCRRGGGGGRGYPRNNVHL